MRQSFTSLLVLTAVAVATVTAEAAPVCEPGGARPTLTINATTGDFTLSHATEWGEMIHTGRLTATTLTATARTAEQTVVYTLTVSDHGSAREVTVGFGDLGGMTYRLEGNGDVAVLEQSIADCQALADSYVLRAIRATWGVLNLIDRSWQSLPQATQAARIVDGPALFFVGTDFVEDCGHFVRPQDTWGCDGLPTWVDCGPKGHCCDAHDDCYAQNSCTSASWVSSASPACVGCNAAVVACFGNVFSVGKSECCSRGNCGEER